MIRLSCWLESFESPSYPLDPTCSPPVPRTPCVLLGDVSRDMIDDVAPRTTDDMKPATNFSPSSSSICRLSSSRKEISFSLLEFITLMQIKRFSNDQYPVDKYINDARVNIDEQKITIY